MNTKLLAIAIASCALAVRAEQLSGGNYTLEADDPHLAEGTWEVGGELQPKDGVVFAGADWTCAMVAFQQSGISADLAAGSVTITGTGQDGMWAPGGAHLNFTATSTAALTMPFGLADIYRVSFGGGKVRYVGDRLTQDEFDKLFETSAGPTEGSTTIRLIQKGENFPELSGSSVMMGSDDDVLVGSATLASAVGLETTVYVAYDTSDHGSKLESWGANVLSAGTFEGTEARLYASGVPARELLVVRVFAVNAEGASVSEPVTIYTRQYGLDGTVNEYVNATGDGLYGTAGNWTLGHTPKSNEIRYMDSGEMTYSGEFVTRPTDVFRGGHITVTGEFKPVNGTEFAGTDFTFTIISTPNGDRPTVMGGHFTATSDNHGGYYNGGNYINLPQESKALFTFPIARDAIFSTVQKFRLAGATITREAFDDPEIWTVEEDAEAGTTTFGLTPPKEGAAELGATQVVVNASDATRVDVAVTVLKIGASQPTEFVVTYGLSADDMTETAAIEAAGGVKEGGVYAVSLTGLEARRQYHYQVVLVNSAGTARSEIGTFVTYNVPAGSAVWTGKKDASASDAENWYGGTLPTETSDIEVIDIYAESPTLVWDLPTRVKSWTQESFAGGEPKVVFATTKENPLVVTGDVLLLAGSWTSQGPADEPTACVNVRVGGDMTVGAGAKVTSGRTGYRQGPGASVNYGTLEDADEEGNPKIRQLWTGGSHAGDGGHPTYQGAFVSYGSIVNPLDWGSAGKGDFVDTYSGGGLVILSVAGALVVDGTVDANGFGYNLDDFAGSSGGTVNVTAGTLAGTGRISANGGSCNCGPGGGGRVRVALTAAEATFDGFGADRITANSGTLENGAPMTTKRDTVTGAAGTVTLVAGGRTTVLVADTLTSREPTTETLVSATHLPASLNPTEDLKATDWELRGNAKLRLTAKAHIASLAITDTAKQKVFLQGHVLKVGTLSVAGVEKPIRGTFTSAQLNARLGLELFAGEGQVVVGTQGFVLLIK